MRHPLNPAIPSPPGPPSWIPAFAYLLQAGRNDCKGNGHILIIMLAIATQRKLCFNKRFL